MGPAVRRIILILLLFLAAVVFASLPAWAQSRLDFPLRALVNAPQAGLSVHRHDPASDAVGVILEYTGDPANLRSHGAKTRTRLGSIFTADIPVNKLNALSALPGMKYIQAARRFDPMLDVSVPETGASSLRQGTPPAWTGYTGKGVIVGIIDTGIDFNHSDFRDPAGHSRVLYIWDQTTGITGANHPTPYDYGTEWTKAQIDAGQCTEKDTSGHGTVVAGIAAGNGSATGNGWPAYRYVGMAPEADIIFVKSAFYSDDVVDGMNYIKSKANSLGKPFVINLSIGSHYGAHDGTDLMERAIDQISGSGAAVCVPTGNSGTTDSAKYIHAQWAVPARNSTVTANINVLSNRSNPSYIDLWYEGNDAIDVTITSPNGYSVTKSTGTTTGGYVTTADGGIWIENSPGGPNPYNSDNECVVAIQNAVPGAWKLTSTGRTIRAGGQCDAWIFSSQNVYWSSYGTNTKSITIPGTSASAITVSGYVTKSWWHNPDGTLQGFGSTYGQFYSTSGEGPTRDGRQKPDLAVPTTRIATSISANSNPPPTDIVEDGVHLVMTGTSMAAPHMTGSVALMLQKDPAMTAAEAKDRVVSATRTDSFTGSVPNTKWGNGKLDLQGAMPLVPLMTDVPGARAQPDGSLVKLRDQIVTAGIDQLLDRFYIESPDRSCGLQVRRTSGDQPFEGNKVAVSGVIGLVDGERAILNSSITRTGTGTVPKSLSVLNRDLDGYGPDTVGLLVTAWGRVTSVGTNHFYMDDGWGRAIKVYCPGLNKPSVGKYAVVTGISSVELQDSELQPLVRVRKQSDLISY